MSEARICDKCKVIIEGSKKASDSPPDFMVVFQGNTILSYEDLCKKCKERCVSYTNKYLAVSTRQRQGKSDNVAEKAETPDET